MIKFLIAAVLFISLSAAVNAQSKDCCSDDKTKTTSVSKHCDVPETVSKDAANTTQVAGALADEKTKKEVKTDAKVKAVTDAPKDEKGCCSADEKKTDEPKK